MAIKPTKRHRQKDFHRKQLRNPYFGKPEKAPRRIPTKFLGGLGFLVVVGFIMYLLNSSALAVTTINVGDTTLIDKQQIIQTATSQLNSRRFLVFSQHNLYFFSKNQLAKSLQHSYTLDGLTISKHYPHTLEISIAERQPAFIWITGQDKYYVDKNGVNLLLIDNQKTSYRVATTTALIRPQDSVSAYPLVYDDLNEATTVGSAVLAPAIMSPLSELLQAVQQRIDVPIAHYTVNRATREITAYTQAGWQIRFSADKPISNQVDLVEVTLRDTIKDTSKLQYIDVRFGDKIFYR